MTETQPQDSRNERLIQQMAVGPHGQERYGEKPAEGSKKTLEQMNEAKAQLIKAVYETLPPEEQEKLLQSLNEQKISLEIQEAVRKFLQEKNEPRFKSPLSMLGGSNSYPPNVQKL